jgi:hypothetical protein
MRDVTQRHSAIAISPGHAVEDWVAEAVDAMFGRTSLTVPKDVPPRAVEDRPAGGRPADLAPAAETTPPTAAPEHRKIRIAMSEDAPTVSSSGPTGEMQEALIESYAEASAQLGEVAAWLREERDTTRSRIEHVTRALEVGEAIGQGTDVVAALARALGILGEAAGTLHASFALPTPMGSFRPVLHPPLAEDPLLKSRVGLRSLEAFRQKDQPSLVRTSDVHELDAVLESVEPRFAAVVVVPFRGTEKLLGFALLYYTLDRALPSASTLTHLGLLARILRTPLELAEARGAF